MSGTANTGAGLFFGDPIDSYTLEQGAPQLVPSTPGEVARAVAGETIAGLPSLGLAKRYVQAAQADPASYLASEPGPAFSNPVPALSDVPPEPNIPKDQLNKDYGIPGVLSFDKDMPASIAQDIHDHHVAEIQRQDILQRNASGLASGGLARFLVSSAVSLADPLNVAAQFVPGLPEARVAGVLGEAALGAGGRAAVRAITGASQGALGTALLQPIDYLNNKADLDDWNAGTALSSVAFGGLLGGLLHPGIGAVGEALTGKLPDWAAQIDGLPTKIQEAAGRGALVDTLNGDPPDAEPLINTGNAFRTIDETPQVLQGIAERFDNENTPPTEEEQRALMGYGRDDTPPDFGQGVNDEIEKILGLQQEKGLEHAAFFDPFSNSFLNFDYSTQTRNQVNIPGSIVELIHNPHEALGILHTHPDKNSLSDADLNTSSFPGVGYIAAHTPGGETFIGKYTGDPKRLAENYAEAVDKVTNFFSDLFHKGYFGPRSEEAGLRFSFKVTDVINRVLAYGGLLDYASTAGLTPEETDGLLQIGREIYGDEGNSGIARSTRQLAQHEAVGELLRRSEEAAATRPGSRLRDSRRAAYDKAFAELKKQIAAEAPPEIGPDDFMAMSADQKAAYFYQVMKASGLSKDDLPEFSSQILDMVEQARQSAEQGAQRLAQNATPKQSDADVSAKRELLRRIQEAPEISGRPENAAKDQATAEKLNADFAEFVAGEKAAGRWTEDDDKALASIQQDEERTLAGAELCRSLGNCIAGGS